MEGNNITTSTTRRKQISLSVKELALRFPLYKGTGVWHKGILRSDKKLENE